MPIVFGFVGERQYMYMYCLYVCMYMLDLQQCLNNNCKFCLVFQLLLSLFRTIRCRSTLAETEGECFGRVCHLKGMCGP